MIQVENLVKEFDGLRALDGLCLNVPDGCVYGLVGPNGAGKTTVIRHLTGVYRQDSGCVRWTKNGPSAGFPRVCRSRPRSGWPFPAVRII